MSGSTGLLLGERVGEGEGRRGQEQQGGEPAHRGWTAASPPLAGYSPCMGVGESQDEQPAWRRPRALTDSAHRLPCSGKLGNPLALQGGAKCNML